MDMKQPIDGEERMIWKGNEGYCGETGFVSAKLRKSLRRGATALTRKQLLKFRASEPAPSPAGAMAFSVSAYDSILI